MLENQMLKVMDELNLHPAFIAYEKEITKLVDQQNKSQLNFEIIRTKISHKEYKNITEWKEDIISLINSTFKNSSQELNLISKYLENLFHKLCNKNIIQTRPEWMLKLSQIDDKINALLLNSSPNISQNIENKKFISAPTNIELFSFTTFCRKSNNPLLIQNVFSILETFNFKPDDSGKIRADLHSLSPNVAGALHSLIPRYQPNRNATSKTKR